MVARAYHALLSHGGVDGEHPECMYDEAKAKFMAAGYALRHWKELQ
jgi:hypothetical protein